MQKSTAIPRKPRSQKQKGHPEIWMLGGALVTLLLSFASVSDVGRTTAIALRCGAGMAFGLAIWLETQFKLPYKKPLAVVFLAGSLICGVYMMQLQPPQASAAITSSGPASSTGANSPAVTGSGNSIGYGATAPAGNYTDTVPTAKPFKTQPAGSASSNGDQSPAVSGSGNNFTYGAQVPHHPPKGTKP